MCIEAVDRFDWEYCIINNGGIYLSLATMFIRGVKRKV